MTMTDDTNHDDLDRLVTQLAERLRRADAASREATPGDLEVEVYCEDTGWFLVDDSSTRS